MKQTIDAIYENGLLRPLEPLHLPERKRVRVTIDSVTGEDWRDADVLEWAGQQGVANISLDEVRQRLAKLNGSLSDLVIAERGEY